MTAFTGSSGTTRRRAAGPVVDFAELMQCPAARAPFALFGRIDAHEFPDAGQVIIDRTDDRHIAFGAGPRRCLGAHLARLELAVALPEWHAAIPGYHADPAIPMREHGGQTGLSNLPLAWTP